MRPGDCDRQRREHPRGDDVAARDVDFIVEHVEINWYHHFMGFTGLIMVVTAGSQNLKNNLRICLTRHIDPGFFDRHLVCLGQGFAEGTPSGSTC